MKIQEDLTANKIRMSAISESCNFDIDEDMKAHVFRMLREGIYSDAKMACLREYICNAIDSNIEAGKTAKEVQITLPTQWSNELIIKDVGLGLDHDDVLQIFRFYGSSTKRESNDVVGCLGIGSKAAFSYTDTFSVIARKDGKERIYTATISRSSDDEAGRGSIHKLAERDTVEHNGVEIKIPVKQSDVHAFTRSLGHFLSFYPEAERPTVTNANFVVEDRMYNYTIGKCSLFIDQSRQFNNRRESFAIMGNVPYKIETSKLVEFDYPVFDENGEAKRDDRGRVVTEKISFTQEELQVFYLGVDMRFDIGELDIAISREGLRYKPNTLMNLKLNASAVVHDMREMLNKQLDSCKNAWEARLAAIKIKRNGSTLEYKVYRDVFNRNFSIKWKGQEIEAADAKLPVDDDNYDYWWCHRHNTLDDKPYRDRISYIQADENPCIVINDAPKYGELQRVATVLDELKWDRFFLLRFPSDQIQNDWLKTTGLNKYKIYKLSDFKRKVNFVKNKQAKASVFSIDIQRLMSTYTINSSHWQKEDIDLSSLDKNEKIYYVDIYRFRPVSGSNTVIGASFMSMAMKFVSSRVKINKIYGLKKQGKAELMKEDSAKNHLVNIMDLFEAELVKANDEAKKLSKMSVNARYFNTLTYEVPRVRSHKIVTQAQTLKQDNPMRIFIESYWKMFETKAKVEKSREDMGLRLAYDAIRHSPSANKYTDLVEVFSDGNNNTKPDYDLIDLFNKVKIRFPMIQFLNRYQIIDDNKINDTVFDYLMEKQ